MKEHAELLSKISESAKLYAIEKVMPNSGTFRQLEQNQFTTTQTKMLWGAIENTISWEVDMRFEKVRPFVQEVSVIGHDDFGNKYQASAIECSGEIQDVIDIEVVKNKTL